MSTNDEGEVDAGVAEKLGLTRGEYARIVKLLGRNPNFTELGCFSAMWSEHCSYKNSRRLFKLFPTKGKQVVVGAGEENTGIVDIGGGMGVAFKIESQPSIGGRALRSFGHRDWRVPAGHLHHGGEARRRSGRTSLRPS